MLPLLVRIEDLETGASQQHAFERSPVRLGRNPLNDVVLGEGFVSQWHGVLRFDYARTEYIDLGSSNGTLANGQRMEKNTPLAVGSAVELRVVSLRINCWRAAISPELAKAYARNTLGPAAQTMMDVRRASLPDEPAAAGQRFPEAIAAVGRLTPLYQEYRRAASALVDGIRAALEPMPLELRQGALHLLQREQPAVTHEEEFRAVAREHRVELVGTGLDAGAAELAQKFAGVLVPGLVVGTVEELEALLVRVATVLETSARAFLELQKGHEQFGSQMAVRVGGEPTPLHRAREVAEVLAYLLDPRADVSARIQELTRAYADIMVHQVALLSGMMEGVRGLLARISPAEIERELVQRGVWRSWPFRAGAQWRGFVERHRLFVEEERELTSVVFGREFARAYAAVAGDEAPSAPNPAGRPS